MSVPKTDNTTVIKPKAQGVSNRPLKSGAAIFSGGNHISMARRTELIIHISGVDVSADINRYFISAVYTDNSEDKADDLQIELDDRESYWLEWLGSQANAALDMKGARISCVIVQRNWESGNDNSVHSQFSTINSQFALDCGEFEIDSMSASGPPSRVSIKATSLPHASTVRTEIKTKAWENIKLSAIANEIASENGLQCMFESGFNPLYDRREQIHTSDVVFLKELCYSAGISLKVTDNQIVLFDNRTYEQKAAVYTIQLGGANVIKWNFSTSLKDADYSACRVSYTNPQTGETIEYTHTPPNANPNGQTLEINEKVSTQDEARQLAENRGGRKTRTSLKRILRLLTICGLSRV